MDKETRKEEKEERNGKECLEKDRADKKHRGVRSDERCRSSPSTKRSESALLFPNTRVKKHQLHVTEGDVG